MSNFVESDEAYARRLQDQELGNYSTHNAPDAQTPLMQRNHDNPTVVNARLNEISSSRATLGVIFTINVPQIVATIIVLSMHWDDSDVCDSAHTERWKLWAIMSALRMFAYCAVILGIHTFKPWLEEHQSYLVRAISFRNAVDAFGLLWFVMGNMWLFGDEDHSCTHPQKSPIYTLCISMLIINYIQICLPCILAILIIPVFCLCMPCLIRILARLQSPRAAVGATDTMIESLPEIVITAAHLRPGEDNTCPICLNEMAVGDAARALRCEHVFHKQCVDEWLRVNASCPTCRKRIIDDGVSDSEHGDVEMNNATSTINSTGSGGVIGGNVGTVASPPNRGGAVSTGGSARTTSSPFHI